MNETELRRRISSYPLRHRQNRAFKQTLGSG